MKTDRGLRGWDLGLGRQLLRIFTSCLVGAVRYMQNIKLPPCQNPGPISQKISRQQGLQNSRNCSQKGCKNLPSRIICESSSWSSSKFPQYRTVKHQVFHKKLKDARFGDCFLARWHYLCYIIVPVSKSVKMTSYGCQYFLQPMPVVRGLFTNVYFDRAGSAKILSKCFFGTRGIRPKRSAY